MQTEPNPTGELREAIAAASAELHPAVPAPGLERPPRPEFGDYSTNVAMLAAPLVGEPPRRDGQQPAARVVRDAVGRPLNGRGEERLLDGVLGRVEGSVPADERTEDLRRKLAQQALDPGVVGPGTTAGHIS